MVEVAGVEPASFRPSRAASTVIVRYQSRPSSASARAWAQGQLPGEDTVCSPRVAPHTMPAVVAGFS